MIDSKCSLCGDPATVQDLCSFCWQQCDKNQYQYQAKTDPTSMAEQIKLACEEIKQMLLSKNERYKNSAAEPLRVFSKADNLSGIEVRIDDKLSRIANGTIDNEDSILDLIGYLILYRILKERKKG